MGTSRHEEIERKYEVDATTILPTLADLDGVSAMGQPVERELEAVYFDTADLDLARRGTTLRRRTGGDDAGWHLKLPGDGEDTRSEIILPLGRATKTVPARLLEPVRALVRDRRLTPVARVSTRRREHALVTADADVLAQMCDDEVHAERLHGAVEVQEWREWEVELVDGTRPLLDAVEERLLAAGASPAAARSKLIRTLADAVPPAPKTPSRKGLSNGSAAQLVFAHLATQTEELHRQDARLRADLPGSVHKMRIAARRLRSALATYRPLLAPGSADTVGDELRWLGQALSNARDAQVMRERLLELVASEPSELVLGPVSTRIDDDLSTAYRTGREQALEALGTKRYFRLLDALDDLVQSAPVADAAAAPALDMLPRLLQRDAKRLRRAVREVARTDDGQSRDLALHEARKKAKRLRYAAESAVPVLGSRATTLAASAKNVQEALGQHQDAVVARQKLREYGAQTHDGVENGFTFGRLHALEQSRADEAERRFEAAWQDLPHRKLRRWFKS